MKRHWKYGLGLSLGLFTVPAWAGNEPVPPVASLGRPVATLGRPVPATSTPVTESPYADPNILPTVFDAPSLTLPEGKAHDQDRDASRLPTKSPVFRTEPCSVKGPGKDGPVPPPVSESETLPAPKASGARVEPEPLMVPNVNPGAAMPGSRNGGVIVVPNGVSPGIMPVPTTTLTPGTVLSESCGPLLAPTTSAADCGKPGCWGNSSSCPNNEFYVSAEYLLWGISAQRIPALVTTGSVRDLINSPANDPRAAVIGSPGTTVVLGDRISDQTHSGGRVTAGWWFADDHCLGLEASGLWVGKDAQHFNYSSPGVPIIGRPFVDQNGVPRVQYVSLAQSTAPGTVSSTTFSAMSPIVLNTFAGSVAVDSTSEMWGGELNLRSQICCGGWYHVDVLGGVRFLQLNEGLTITENITSLASQQLVTPVQTGQINQGDTFFVQDRFNTQNSFYGGQIGTEAEFRYQRWYVDLRTTVALGTTHQSVNIQGATLFNGMALSPPGGLLAQPTNIGLHSRNVFSVVPEMGVNVGYQVCDHLRLYVGYRALFWSNVARPGPQIDTRVDTRQVTRQGGNPAPTLPPFAFNGSGLWAQGVNFGLELRY